MTGRSGPKCRIAVARKPPRRSKRLTPPLRNVALPFTKRAHVLEKAAEIFEKRKMEIVEALQAEGGGWFGKGMFETGYTVEVLRAAAASVWQSTGEVLPSEYGKLSMAVRRPMGVISIISPWNFPCILSSPIAFRSRPETRSAAGAVGRRIAGVCFSQVFEQAGMPKGVFNVVTCSNVQEVGDELIEHPYVKGISFTGSSPVSRRVAQQATP